MPYSNVLNKVTAFYQSDLEYAVGKLLFMYQSCLAMSSQQFTSHHSMKGRVVGQPIHILMDIH